MLYVPKECTYTQYMQKPFKSSCIRVLSTCNTNWACTTIVNHGQQKSMHIVDFCTKSWILKIRFQLHSCFQFDCMLIQFQCCHYFLQAYLVTYVILYNHRTLGSIPQTTIVNILMHISFAHLHYTKVLCLLITSIAYLVANA